MVVALKIIHLFHLLIAVKDNLFKAVLDITSEKGEYR